MMNVMERFYDKDACSFGDTISHNGTGALNLTKTISSSWPGPRSPFHFFSKGETPPSVPFAGKWYLVAAHVMVVFVTLLVLGATTAQ
jgi:hypothetical protein